MDRKRLLRNPLIWILAAVLVFFAFSVLFDDTRGYTQVDTSVAIAQIENGNVKDALIEDREQRLRLTLDQRGRGQHPDHHAVPGRAPATRSSTRWRTRTTSPTFNTAVHQDSFLTQMLIYLVPLGLVLLILFWMMNNAQGGGNRVMSFGKSKAKQLNKDMPKTTFADVAGADEAVEELVRDQGLPAEPGPLPGARREDPQGRAALRPARHRQDAAGARGRRRGGRAVLHDLRLGLRRDVRRRRRLPRARPVRAGQAELAVHHLRRRDRRGRPPARRRPRRRPRRARADAQPAARRDGRLRRARRHHPDRGHQPARHPRPGAAAPRPVRPPDPGQRARPRRPPRRSSRCTPRASRSRRTSTSTASPSAPSACPAPTWPTSSTRPRCSPRASTAP